MMRRLLFAALAALSFACAPSLQAQPPRFGVAASLAADTVEITVNACAPSGATTQCRYRFATDVNFTQALGSVQTIAAGQTLAVMTLTCPAVNVDVDVYGRAWGVNASGTESVLFTSDHKTVHCPDGNPNAPPFTIQLRVRPGGGG